MTLSHSAKWIGFNEAGPFVFVLWWWKHGQLSTELSNNINRQRIILDRCIATHMGYRLHRKRPRPQMHAQCLYVAFVSARMGRRSLTTSVGQRQKRKMWSCIRETSADHIQNQLNPVRAAYFVLISITTLLQEEYNSLYSEARVLLSTAVTHQV